MAAAVMGATPAIASGGGGGGGGGQGRGGNACVPLSTIVKVAHADGSGNFGISVQATLSNCGRSLQHLQLNVTVPNSREIPFNFSTGAGALPPGVSLRMGAGLIGSTPTELQYGHTYNVVATLTETTAAPTVLSRIVTVVKIPATVAA
jgi:hypothetical protein